MKYLTEMRISDELRAAEFSVHDSLLMFIGAADERMKKFGLSPQQRSETLARCMMNNLIGCVAATEVMAGRTIPVETFGTICGEAMSGFLAYKGRGGSAMQ